MSAQDSRDVVDVGGTELADALAVWRRGIELELRVSMPAHVTAYNAAAQTATVQLGLVPVRYVEDEEVAQAPIVIPGVPVIWPGSALSYVTTPLLPGDSGLVVFADRCLAEWLRVGAPTDPINGRAHALGDAMFFPGLRPTTDPITPPTDLTATVVEGPLVRLGRTATQGVILDASGAQAALTAAVSALATITAAPIPEPPAPGAGAAIDAMAAALLAVVQALTVSTKVMAEPVP